MAKLNESKRSERTLRTSLEELERKCGTWQEKAEEAEKVGKRSQALQNTIDHLENRLEISNIERLDAEEQLFNIQTQKSPFDFSLPNLQNPCALKHEHTKVGHNASKHSQCVSTMGITMIQMTIDIRRPG
jgi:chromosome segregation ATPase